ncbi:MAG: hypothetical protein ACO31I_00280 [Prochlorotrichaceae cyanobacterium]|jgi:hypothetical protein
MKPDYIFYGLIVTFFLLGVIYDFWRFWQSKNRWKTLERFIKSIRENKPNRLSPQELRWRREHFAGVNDELQGFIPNKSGEYYRLVKYPDEISAIPKSTVRFIPPVLTALGILGTFWGITQGLEGVSLDSSDTAKSLESAITLIDGMKTAFYTSLAGLGCSTFMSSVLAFTDKFRKENCIKLRRSLEAIAIVETSESALSRLNLDATAQAAQQLSTLANQFNAKEIGQAVGEEVGKQLSATIQQYLKPTFDRIENTNTNLADLVSEQKETLSSLISEMRTELILPVTDRLDQSGKLLERSSSSLDQASSAIQSLNKDLGEIAQKLGESSVVLEQFQRETLQYLRQFVNALKKVLDQFREETSSALIQTSQEIRSGTIEILQEARQTFQEQNSILKSIGIEASNLMNSSCNALLRAMEDIDKRLLDMSNLTQQQLNEFREAYQRNLQDFFDKQNNLLEETLGEQRDGLAEVVRDLNSVFISEYERRTELNTELNRQMEIFRQNANKAIELSTAIENSYSQRIQQLNEISETVADQVERIEGSNIKLNQAYHQSIEALETALSQMIEGENHFFNEADSAMARVSSGLLEVAQVLVEAKNQS